MGDISIKVEDLSKLYRLGVMGTGTISHDLNRWWHQVRGKGDPYAMVGAKNDRTIKDDNAYVWALQDINFEVKKGEILGIIGRNGAGKSTLLKIFSKVTGPTSGRIEINGRIAALLEVGTGFHQELTGRENVYLNGAIMGMTKKEIARKFDEIVDFSGCEKYIDTPIKRFSSGMKVRLGFAVAAYLESEILIVDEVLAVGDAEFQRKSIGKMQEVSQSSGKTVLFVSHNFNQIQSLCSRALLLSNGAIHSEGPVEKIISNYIFGESSKRVVDLTTLPVASNIVPGFKFCKFEMLNAGETLNKGDSLRVRIDYEITAPLRELVVGITISDAYHTLIECRSTSDYDDLTISRQKSGSVEVIVELNLGEGSYSINLGARSLEGLLSYLQNVSTIEIIPASDDQVESWKKPNAGVVISSSKWKLLN